MKWGKRMRLLTVPAWSAFYLDYEGLKHEFVADEDTSDDETVAATQSPLREVECDDDCGGRPTHRRRRAGSLLDGSNVAELEARFLAALRDELARAEKFYIEQSDACRPRLAAVELLASQALAAAPSTAASSTEGVAGSAPAQSLPSAAPAAASDAPRLAAPPSLLIAAPSPSPSPMLSGDPASIAAQLMSRTLAAMLDLSDTVEDLRSFSALHVLAADKVRPSSLLVLSHAEARCPASFFHFHARLL